MTKLSGSKTFKLIACALLVSCLTLPSASAEPASPRPLEIPDPAYPPQPAFFVVKDNDSILYIMGSMHKFRKNTKWLTPQARTAFSESDRLWFEITQADSAHPILQIKSMRAGEAEEGQTLPMVLTPEEYERTTKAANSIGLEMSSLDSLKPWLVGDIIRGTFQAKIDEKKYDQGSSTPKPTETKDDKKDDQKTDKATTPADKVAADKKSTDATPDDKLAKTDDKTAQPVTPKGNGKDLPQVKHRPQYQGGVEEMFEQMSIGKDIKSIENVERHVLLFDNLPIDVQRKYLMNAIEEMEDKSDEAKALAKAWRTGDLAMLAKREVAQMKAENEQFYDAMLRLRNVEMADRAEEILKGSGTDFFIVGAAHLSGPDSVLELLRAKGHYPVRLYDTQPPVATYDPQRAPDIPLYHVVPEPMPRLELQLLPATEKNPGQPRLRLLANYVTNGCGEYLPLLYKVRKDGNIFEVRTSGGTLFVSPPQNRETCGTPSKIPYVDIPLNVKEMRDMGVSTIWMLRGGGLDKIDVDITDDTISVTPQENMRYFKTRKYGPMTASWFDNSTSKNDIKGGKIERISVPEEILIYLEDAKVVINDHVKALMDDLLQSRNLAPTDTPAHYLDKGGQFAMNLRHTDVVRIGSITLDDGRKIGVMARRP